MLFTRATWSELEPWLDGNCVLVAPAQWTYPKEEPCLWLYPYDDLLNEYDDEDLDRVFAVLDDFPSSILCIELSGACFDRACECAIQVILPLLSQFHGVVDDGSPTCRTKDDIAKGVERGHFRFAFEIRDK